MGANILIKVFFFLSFFTIRQILSWQLPLKIFHSMVLHLTFLQALPEHAGQLCLAFCHLHCWQRAEIDKVLLSNWLLLQVLFTLGFRNAESFQTGRYHSSVLRLPLSLVVLCPAQQLCFSADSAGHNFLAPPQASGFTWENESMVLSGMNQSSFHF